MQTGKTDETGEPASRKPNGKTVTKAKAANLANGAEIVGYLVGYHKNKEIKVTEKYYDYLLIYFLFK